MLNTLWSTPDHIPINKCRDPMKETASERVETHLPWKQDPPHTHPAPSSGIVYRMSLRRHCGRAPCRCIYEGREKWSRIQTPLAPDPEHSVPAASAAFLTDRSIAHCWTMQYKSPSKHRYPLLRRCIRSATVSCHRDRLHRSENPSSQLTFVWSQTGSIRLALSYLNIYGVVHLRVRSS